MSVDWKIWFLGWGGSRGNKKIEKNSLKKELGQVGDLMGGLVKKKEWYFWGRWYPNAHYGYKKQEPKY